MREMSKVTSKLLKTVEGVYTVWFDNEISGYNVPDFHEWSEEERKERLTYYNVVPVLKISDDLYNYIENGMNEIPQQLLDDVKDKTRVVKNYKLDSEKYIFIVTNGKRTLIVDTLETNKPKRKGRLFPKMEHFVNDVIEDSEADTYEFDKSKQHKHLYDPKHMIGLTRKERQKKEVLYFALNDCEYEENKDVHKIKYYYGEFNYKGLNDIKDNTYDEVLHKLREEIQVGWTENHDNLAKAFIVNDEFLAENYYVLD